MERQGKPALQNFFKYKNLEFVLVKIGRIQEFLKKFADD